MGITERLLRLTLASLHCTIWAKSWITTRVGWLWACIVQLTTSKYKGKKLESIAADSKDLEKIPHHLAFIVHQDFVSCDDLAQVAVWAFASGIKTVSFYDPNGKIMDHRAVLQAKISVHHQQIFSPPLPDFRVTTSHDLFNLQTSQPQSCTDFYQVVLLSPEDGHQRLTQVAAEVCQAMVSRREQLELINVDSLTPRITGAVSLEEPEVVLIFGDVCSTMGYPPWHLRLSEIHMLPSHHKIQYKDFYSVLQKYSSCKQRLGK